MKKLLLLMLLAVCCMASGWAQPYRVNRQRLRIEGVTFAKRAQVSDQNYLYMADFAIKPGETKVVPIYLSNTLPMWMFQCDLELPAGLTAIDADFSSAMSSSTMSGQYSLATGNVDGCFRMLVYNQSKTKSIPAGTQFHILNVTIKASENLTPNQTLTATIKNFDFIDANSDEGITGANKSCTVTVNPILVSSISLSKTSVTLQPGGTLQLTASISPSNATNKNVTWSSSNTSVATVSSSGKVTAVSPGSTTITVRTVDGSNLSASCTVTVNPILVSSISLNKTSATLQPGGTLQLTASISPSNATNRNVTWSSSNTSVATVSTTGKVTALKPGNTTITVCTTDGSNLSASCTVTVNPILVSSISLNQTSVSIQSGNTLQLTASISPSNATDKNVTWSSSNTSVATVTSAGKVTAKVPGTATITAKTADGSNLTATCAVTVTPAKGDLNEDGKVDKADYALLVTRIADQAVYNSKFDLDGNGQVDVLDANWLLDVIGN